MTMRLTLDSDAPPWASAFARRIEAAIGDGATWPFISRQTYTVSQLTAALAVSAPWGMAIVSNGAGGRPLAISNGTIFVYLDGTTV